jgi:hypothetical protein
LSDHLSAETLIDLADNVTDGATTSAAEQHLAGCSSCRAELDALRRVNAGVSSIDLARVARRAVGVVALGQRPAAPLQEVVGQFEELPPAAENTFLCRFDEAGLELHCVSFVDGLRLIIRSAAGPVTGVRAPGLTDNRSVEGGWIGRIAGLGERPLVIEIDAGGATFRVDLLPSG